MTPPLFSVNQLLGRALLGGQFAPKPLSAKTATIGAATQTTGTGLSDITSGGTYTALVDHVYRVKITTAGTPDHFQYSVDGGAYGNDAAITGSAQNLANGVQVTFAATTGHTLNDVWTITVKAGVAIATASTFGNITVNSVGSGAELVVYDGADSTGTVLYDVLTASWTAGSQYFMGYRLQNAGGLYIALYASTTYPNLIVGYN